MNRKREKQKSSITKRVLAAMLTLMMLCGLVYSPSVFAAGVDSDTALEATTEGNGETDVNTDIKEDANTGVTENDVTEQQKPSDSTEASDNAATDGENVTTVPDGDAKTEGTEADVVADDAVMTIDDETGDAGQDRNFIIVQKTFEGITDDQIPPNFKINVKNQTTGNSYVLTDGIPGLEKVVDNENKHIVWRWKVMDAVAGSYNVTEENYAVENYDVSKVGEGQIKVIAADMEVKVLSHETTCSHKNWPISEGTFFAATLTDGGIAVITEHSLSDPQRKTVADALVGKINGPWKNPVYFYSIDEQIKNGEGFKLNGATITYDFNTKEMIIGDTSDWQHVATVWYDIQAAQNPSIGITNTYTPATVNVNIKKQVTGNFGDWSKLFKFTVSHDGTSTDFELKHGESYTIENVKKGSNITISETNADDYSKTFTVKSGETVIAPNADGSYTIPSDAEAIEIVVENHKEIIIDTGVILDSLPYILILAVVVAAVVVFVIRRRRKAC